MPYIGNTIRAADDYRLIDDISSGFNGSATSFALQVAGSAPVPFPKSPQQVLISVNGVIQEPDPTGSSGFNLVGTNIVFSSAPTNGHAFFGIIYATADYLNSGGNFPSGSTGSPSLTFIGDEDTGIYRKGSGSVGFVSNSTEIANTDSNGLTISSGSLIIPDSIIHNGDTDTKIRFSAADTVSVETGGAARAVINSTGLAVTGTVETTNHIQITHTSPSLYLTDSDANPDYVLRNAGGQFIIRDDTNGATRLAVNTDGHVDITGNLDVGAGIDVTGAVNSGDITVTSGAPFISFVDSDHDSDFNIQINAGSLNFNDTTNSATRMSINSSGNVGIGNTSPNSLLNIHGVFETNAFASSSGSGGRFTS